MFLCSEVSYEDSQQHDIGGFLMLFLPCCQCKNSWCIHSFSVSCSLSFNLLQDTKKASFSTVVLLPLLSIVIPVELLYTVQFNFPSLTFRGLCLREQDVFQYGISFTNTGQNPIGIRARIQIPVANYHQLKTYHLLCTSLSNRILAQHSRARENEYYGSVKQSKTSSPLRTNVI